MRLLFLLLLLTIACGSNSTSEKFDSIKQEYNGPPHPPIVCDENLVLCGIDCIDISKDNLNCGECNKVCNIINGEFCSAYFCKNVRDYGYYLGPVGPIEYDIRRDLPRPPSMWENVK